MTRETLLFIGGVGVLYFGAEWLVRGSARLASSMGVKPIVRADSPIRRREGFLLLGAYVTLGFWVLS